MKEKLSQRLILRVIAGSLLATLSLTTVPAFADLTPPPANNDAFKAAMDQFKKDRDAYIALIKDRESKMRAINQTFKAAVDKASSDFKSAIATATTPEQKSAARANFLNSRTAAINTRDAAIAALGALPTPPAEPARPMKNKGDNKPAGMKSKN